MFNFPRIIAFNRWHVVLGALLIQVSLGAIYIYSVFKPALKAHFPSWSATDLVLPSQIILAFFALSMVISGRIQDKIGPKKTSLAGAAILLIGMYIAAKSSGLAQFVFGFGILGGIGIGAAYVCPIAVCAKWFPDKRGLVTGLAVAGFGAGGLVFTPLANYLISAIGIMAALFYLGLIFFFAIAAGAQLMVIPPAGFCPSGWKPSAASAAGNRGKIDYSPAEMVKTPGFWIIWLTYFAGCAAGLMVIMNLTNIWQANAAARIIKNYSVIPAGDFSAILRAGVAIIMAVSILNSLGRIVWGKFSDSFGRKQTLSLIFIICAFSLLLLNFISSFLPFLAAVGMVGFCFGGFLALYPAVTADYFGAKNLGANYGLVFSAYGAGGLLGPWLTPKLMSAFNAPYEAIDASGKSAVKLLEAGNYSQSFLLAGIACLIAAALIARLKKPSSRS